MALINHVLVADDLAAGRLIRPFELSLEVEFTHYLVYPEAAGDDEQIAVFRDWILAAAAREHGSSGAQSAAGGDT